MNDKIAVVDKRARQFLITGIDSAEHVGQWRVDSRHTFKFNNGQEREFKNAVRFIQRHEKICKPVAIVSAELRIEIEWKM